MGWRVMEKERERERPQMMTDERDTSVERERERAGEGRRDVTGWRSTIAWLAHRKVS